MLKTTNTRLRLTLTLGLCFTGVFHTCTSLCAADPAILRLPEPPQPGLALIRANFPTSLVPAGSAPDTGWTLKLVDTASNVSTPAQFIPDVATTTDGGSPTISGRFVVRLPAGSGDTFQIAIDAPYKPTPVAGTSPFRGAGFEITHAAQGNGGLPNLFRLLQAGKQFTTFDWNDRVHDEQQGGFLLRHDKQAIPQVVSAGPLCQVVRTTAAYVRPDGTAPESHPRATYDWYYFPDLPVLFVTASIYQDAPHAWREVHFLELNYPGTDFTHWMTGEPEQRGDLTGQASSQRATQWAAVTDGQNAIAMLRCGSAIIYDGRGGYGTYLHADGDRAWQPWTNLQQARSAWLWLGTSDDLAATLRDWSKQLPRETTGVVSPLAIHDAITAARRLAVADTDATALPMRRQANWASQLEAAGQFDAALAVLQGTPPENWYALDAGQLSLTVQRSATGIRLLSLLDAQTMHEHLPPNPAPLFTLTLESTDGGSSVTMNAEQGWQQATVDPSVPGCLELRWSRPENQALGELTVVARATRDSDLQAIRWSLVASGQAASWSLTHVVFPQLELRPPGADPVVLFPRGPGELQRDVWQRDFVYGGYYPSGWTSMQFLAAYDQSTRRGIYWGLHDPVASTKDLQCVSDATRHTLRLSADHPVPDMTRPGNRFELSGQAVWQLLVGDWYDAARIYRAWVRAEAKWFPTLTAEGRADTPAWLRDLCFWVQTGGPADQCVERVAKFAEYMGVPAGFHWYSWHAIPFDNDYPHYFPTTPGFAEGVARLQQSHVYAMPYINGRLWDTRDHGVEDLEFTSRARAAATKDAHGEVIAEQYGSKEADGSDVRLAVMCPATPTWQNELHTIVSRLVNEYQVAGVYIDQIAAAPPVLCLDPNHGHPLGGGSWWTESYWRLLERIRNDKPPQSMLTTECNAEPFIRWMDGYLTWHWQYDGQVPAFPAIYGGAIQMFGRAYRGGESKDLALRMKAGQQLVFGEQIGWLDTQVMNEPANGPFLRSVVRLRWQLRQFFSAGEMLRPPHLQGTIPTVRADWQWAGTWWVTTDAVLAGAWSLPQQQRVVALFVNVSDEALAVTWTCDRADSGLDATSVQLTEYSETGPGASAIVTQPFQRPLALPPRSAIAVEIRPQPSK